MRLHARFGDEGIEINYPVRKLTTDLPEGLSTTSDDVETPDADAEKAKPIPAEIAADA